MKTRFDYTKASVQAAKAMYSLEASVRHLGLEKELLELVKMRASQINQCAFCLNMHYTTARANGESEQRLNLLPAWREAPCYTDRERAALEWTEAVTLVASTHVPDEVYNRVREQFTEEELTNLTLAVVTINGWNRFSVSFRVLPNVNTEVAPQAAS